MADNADALEAQPPSKAPEATCSQAEGETVVENKIGSLGPPRGYFGTVCSRGVQKMVREEVLLRLQSTEPAFLQGKCFFTTDLQPSAPEFRSVRSVERIFLCLARENASEFKEVPSDKLAALAQMEKALVEMVPWEEMLRWWRAFTGAVEGRQKGST
jgi:23S rRNA G2445 N2-methylase RlmL